MRDLPPTLRKYLANRRYSLVAKGLMTKYGLHIDQGAILEREIMLLLMGIETPDEFVASLKEDAFLSNEIVGGITKDVNDQIFVPLQQQMRQEGSAPSAPARQTPPPPPAVTQPPIATPRYQPPPSPSPLPPRTSIPVSPPPPPSLPVVAPPPPPRPLPPVPPPPSSLGEALRAVTASAPKPQVESRRSLASTGVQTPPPSSPAAPLPPKRTMPGQSFVSPRTLPPLPPSVQPPPPAHRPAPPQPARPPYSDDPYREPVE